MIRIRGRAQKICWLVITEAGCEFGSAGACPEHRVLDGNFSLDFLRTQVLRRSNIFSKSGSAVEAIDGL